MTRRLKLMLAVLAAVAALVLLDRPDGAGVVEASAVRRPEAAVPRKPAQEAPPPPLAADGPIPDLFAGPPAPPPAPARVQHEAEPATERTAKPVTLLGFREEGGARAAYLLHAGDVALARAGDVLGQRYQVLALGGDSVDIKDKRSGAALRIGFEDHQ